MVSHRTSVERRTMNDDERRERRRTHVTRIYATHTRHTSHTYPAKEEMRVVRAMATIVRSCDDALAKRAQFVREINLLKYHAECPNIGYMFWVHFVLNH